MGWLWDHLFKLRSRREKHGSEFSALLSLDNISYANAVFRVFHEMDPATKAHVIVAYQNLIPMLSALWLAAEKTGERATVEGLIEKLSAEISSYRDEINSRRMTWLLAALLGRLEKLAPNNQTVTVIGARIWCSLVQEIPRLKVLLPNNVVWKAKEKEWFDLSKPDHEMVQDGINLFMPPIFGRAQPAKDLAKSLGLFYLPSEGRVGVIP